MSLIIRSLLCIQVLILFNGCVRIPKPQIAGDLIQGTIRESFLTNLENSQTKVQASRIVATTELKYHKEVQRFKQVAVYLAPGNFRLESFPIGAAYALNIIVATEGKVTFVDNGEKKVWVGPDSAEYMSTVTTLPLVADDFASLIAGRLPARVIQDSELHVYLNFAKNQATFLVGDFKQYYLFSLEKNQLIEAEFRPDGAPAAKVTFQYSNNTPVAVTIELPSERTTLSMSYERFDLNPTLKPELFKLKLPQSYKIMS